MRLAIKTDSSECNADLVADKNIEIVTLQSRWGAALYNFTLPGTSLASVEVWRFSVTTERHTQRIVMNRGEGPYG